MSGWVRGKAGWVGHGAAFILLLASTAVPSKADTPPQTATQLAERIVNAFDVLFSGPHPGMRAVHAKGALCEGSFVPSPAARDFSTAPHFAASETPVVVRFSRFAGVPTIGDGDPFATPNGMAVKFTLPDGGETDIVAHSYDGFPVATPEDFLEFLTVVGAKDDAKLGAFLDSHPAAKSFATAPKPAPVSFSTQEFFGVDAFRFTNAAGVSRFGRYRIEPVSGTAFLTSPEAAARDPNYLAAAMKEALDREPVRFRLLVQIPEPGDPITDGSKAWPRTRGTIELGTFTLNRLVPDSSGLQRALLFTPLSLTAGIAPSDDPLLIARNRAYRISFERRSRQARSDQTTTITAMSLRGSLP